MSDKIHRHATRWSFGDMLYHKLSGELGMVVGLQLRPTSTPVYMMTFEGDVGSESKCLEIELTEELPTAVEAK